MFLMLFLVIKEVHQSYKLHNQLITKALVLFCFFNNRVFSFMKSVTYVQESSLPGFLCDIHHSEKFIHRKAD